MPLLVPRGICIACGSARDPLHPSARCPACGHDASTVTWEQVGGHGRDPTVLGATIGGAVLAGAVLVWSALRRAESLPWSAPEALLTAAALLALGLLGAWILRRPYGTWAFFTEDNAYIGTALWSDRAFVWASVFATAGAPILLPPVDPPTDTAPVADTAAPLDRPGLVEALRGPLALDDDDVATLGETLSLPLSSTVAAMLLRGAIRAAWQSGWRSTLHGEGPVVRERRLALEAADATLARGPLEAWIVDALAPATAASRAGDGTAHYRAPSAVAVARLVPWDDLLDRWEDEGAKGDDAGTAALRTIAKADPALGRALLELQERG